MSRRPVTIVVPAKDEEAAIGATLDSLPVETLRTAGYEPEVVVLDGHSTDATVEIARAWGATVVQDRGRGKGAAVRDARHALKGDFTVMMDADGTYAADAIPRVLDPLARGEADVVMGHRLKQPGAMTGVHRFGNTMLSLGATVLYGRRCPDLCTGLWGFRTEALRSLPMQSEGFELEAELFSLSARLRYRIAHTPVDYLPRKGTTKLTALDGLRIGWCLVRSRFQELPPQQPMPVLPEPSGLGHHNPVRLKARNAPDVPAAATGPAAPARPAKRPDEARA
ncbi:MAG TPA: glycosyltransferase family 2 protein [Candidatus Thermoplasmatota archaeon]|nr:glycosyltransferase family 2 protein [Candidatus Thermoplasmatota archaeon]